MAVNETLIYYVTIPSAGSVLFKAFVLPILLIILSILGIYYIFRRKELYFSNFAMGYSGIITSYLLLKAFQYTLSAELNYYLAIALELGKEHMITLFTVAQYGLLLYSYISNIILFLLFIVPFAWLFLVGKIVRR